MPIAPIQLICVSLYFVFISTSVTGPALKGPGRETACARGRFPSWHRRDRSGSVASRVNAMAGMPDTLLWRDEHHTPSICRTRSCAGGFRRISRRASPSVGIDLEA
jgi:hypothetical protein